MADNFLESVPNSFLVRLITLRPDLRSQIIEELKRRGIQVAEANSNE